MEGARRALEKESGMERLSLDPYKKFIKQCVEKDDENENASVAEEKTEEPVHSVEEKESEEKEGGNNKGNLTNSSVNLNKNSEESEMSHESPGHKKEISEDIIKRAIKKRVAYFKGNLEITLIKVRRLLEEDLELEKGSLDAHKKLISSELDKTLQSSDVVDNTNKDQKKISNKKVIKKVNKDPDSSNSDEEPSEDKNEAAKRTKKRPAQKIKNDTKASKKQRVQVESKKTPKKKLAEEDSDENDENSDRKSSEDTDEVRVVKKQNEKPTPAYGKKVDRLRSIIKSCGLGIPPAVYRRAKQAPESKREAELIKELSDILQKEGLSTDPSEKEIQEVKKRKQRAKDLEGIDTSNIVSSSRRRSSNFIPIPPPKIEDSESGEEEEEEEEDEQNEEDSEVRVSDAEVSDDGASDAEGSHSESADEAEDESD